jgi:hypothetical protein
MEDLHLIYYLINFQIYMGSLLFGNFKEHYILPFLIVYLYCDFYMFLSHKYSFYYELIDISLLSTLFFLCPLYLSNIIIMKNICYVLLDIFYLTQWYHTFKNVINFMKFNSDYYHVKNKLNMTATYLNSENDECIICLDTTKSNMFIKLKCNHIFHTKCFEKWLSLKQKTDNLKCILCNQDI